MSLKLFFEDAFILVQEPRANQKRHLLVDILTIGLCTVLCGGEGWDDMEWYGQERQDWFSQFLLLPYGIPSCQTFERVFSAICPKEFEGAIRRVAESLGTAIAVPRDSERSHVCIDGKRLRGSYDKESGIEAVHVINAYDVNNGICLGQLSTESKSNEITAIPHLLQLLDLKDRVVSIDAMGCQKSISKNIRSKKADYILSLKENHGDLFKAVEQLFSEVKNLRDLPVEVSHTTVEKGHGRIETRTCVAIPFQPLWASTKDWQDLKSFVAVDSTREIKGDMSHERRFFLSSLNDDSKELSKLIRDHWAIENCLHWQLDVSFKEDFSRIRTNHGPANMAILRKIALNILKNNKNQKISIRKKKMKAAMKLEYLEELLSQANVLKT